MEMIKQYFTKQNADSKQYGDILKTKASQCTVRFTKLVRIHKQRRSKTTLQYPSSNKSMNTLLGKNQTCLIMHGHGVAIVHGRMSKTFKEVHEAFSRRVRKASVYIMHLHLSIPVHFRTTNQTQICITSYTSK